jgi:hypothetical protein
MLLVYARAEDLESLKMRLLLVVDHLSDYLKHLMVVVMVLGLLHLIWMLDHLFIPHLNSLLLVHVQVLEVLD